MAGLKPSTRLTSISIELGFECSLQYSPQYGLSLKVVDADPAFALGELELKKREILDRLKKEGLLEPELFEITDAWLTSIPFNHFFILLKAGSATALPFLLSDFNSLVHRW